MKKAMALVNVVIIHSSYVSPQACGIRIRVSFIYTGLS